MRRQEAKSYLHSSRHARPDRASLAFAILFTGISPSLLTAESFLFNDARKSSNSPMSKCVFVLIWKCTNVFMCVCVYVLMHVCSRVLMYLCAYMLMYVTMYILMCEYINLSMFKYVWGLMCWCVLQSYPRHFLPPNFTAFSVRNALENRHFFKCSKHLFQPRFHLSVSPDCKMCVRVTNTGEKRRMTVIQGYF